MQTDSHNKLAERVRSKTANVMHKLSGDHAIPIAPNALEELVPEPIARRSVYVTCRMTLGLQLYSN